MNQKEKQRYHLLKIVIDGKIILKDAGSVMEISHRHAKRLKRKLISEGANSDQTEEKIDATNYF